MEILNMLNDTREVLTATRGMRPEGAEAIDVEIGRFFSTSGYKVCTMYGVGKTEDGEGILFRTQTHIDEDGKLYGSVSRKSNFEVDPIIFEDPKDFDSTAKIKDNIVEYNPVHKEHFIRALQVEDYDETLLFSEDDDLPEEVYSFCISLFSPILSF